MNRGGWEGLDMSTIWLGMLLGLPHLEVAGWVVSIATNQIVAVGEGCWRWAHRTVRCATGPCPVCRHVTLLLELGAGWPLEAFVLMRHRTVRCHTGQSGAPLTFCSDFCRVTVLHCSSVRVDRSTQIAVAPLVHRTVRWIIEELRLETRSWGVWSVRSLVHRTLSGAPDQGTLRIPFCSFLLNPNLFFLLVCVEPLAPVECII
jgi:hypothetical protein